MEHFTYTRSCYNPPNSTLRQILYQNTYANQGDLYIPCSYNHIDKELKKIKTFKNEKIFLLNKKINYLVAKDWLYIILRKHYRQRDIDEMCPKTYVLWILEDLKKLQKEFNGKYILKKNIQRQKGLKIVSAYQDILQNRKNYVIAQELLVNPFTIYGRKINIRVYVCIICKNNKVSVYMHNNGFVYYTKVPFRKDTIKDDHHITTGYIDRSVYKTHPLTIQDLYTFLGEPRATILRKNIFTLIYNITKPFQKMFIIKDPRTFFQHFGYDLFICKNLICKIMEVNKGPDMGFKDQRDFYVKRKVYLDMFQLLHLKNDIPQKEMEEKNGFIKVL